MSTDLDSEEMENESPQKCVKPEAAEIIKTEPTSKETDGATSSNEEEMNTDEEILACNIVVKVEKESEEVAEDLITEDENGEVKCRTRQPKNGLSMKLAIDMLTHYKEYLSSIVKNWHPKEGQVYVFDLKKVGQEWKHDGYEWRNNGSSIQPKSSPIMKKVFFIVRSEALYEGDRTFQKVVYSLIDQPQIILVHYFGDSSIQMAIPKRKANHLKAQLHAKKRVKEESFDLSKRPLTIEETVDTLENYEQHLSVCRAVRPKGGDIYVFDRNMIGEDWKCDGYIWRNSGTRYMPSKNPVMRKNFYFIRTKASGDKGSKEFKKSACYLLKRPNIVLVHYMGNETVYTPRRHGNRKKGDVEFQRTCPSVLEAIKSTVAEESPVDTYNRLLHMGGERPRDMKQVQSLKERLTRGKRRPRRKKFMTEHGIQMVEFDSSTMTVEVHNPNDDASQSGIDGVDTSKVTDENIQPLLMEPLDSHPQIRKVQLDILQQQQRNLKLQEEKFRLEIDKLERTKKLKEQSKAAEAPIAGDQVIQYVDESQAAMGDLEEQNVIYVNSENDFIKLTQDMYGEASEGQQYYYVQEGAGGEIVQRYVEPMPSQ